MTRASDSLPKTRPPVGMTHAGLPPADVLFDLGNTRLKWAPLRAEGTAGEVQACANDGWLDALPSGRVAYVASVAATELRTDLLEALSRRFERIAIARTSTSFAGLRIAYARPEKLGVDRFLALLAAHASGAAPALVVGVGTALTIDLVDAGGQHRGGRIAPSPDLMRQALHARAAQLPERGGRYAEFAADTEDALASGCEGAALALVARSVDAAVALLGSTPRLLMHGGGAPALHPGFPGAELVGNLVLQGLARWAAVEHAIA
jgi:type III pantothenate kinase